ncbi:MAG: hypothetical protein CMH12_10665 [Maritimibacter sp.]|nr:hypothetical protein [Maritimibacter sp.]
MENPDKRHLLEEANGLLLRERELAQRWKTSQRTLQRWRSENFGPAYIRIGGAIRYPMKDVLDYEARNRSGEAK